jgi:putative transposase
VATIRERKHRLPSSYYGAGSRVSFTACVRDRVAAFTDASLFRQMETCLVEACTRYGCAADLYLFMPDHAHVVLSALVDGDTERAMKRFKQRSGFLFAQTRRPFAWQKDYHDRVIRNDTEYEQKIRYILANPIRAGLVARWKDYPFKGSMIYDLDAWDDCI